MTPATIGIFDSGMGGLTVLRALLDARAAPRFIYLGDTARLPYGTKSPETVRRYAVTLANQLTARGVDLIVVACNTVSAVALDSLETAGVPIIGVVEPGARVAAAAGGPVGVLGTAATIASGAYERAIARVDPSIEVRSRACPLFVPLVEEGWTEGPVPAAVAGRYLAELGDVRTVLLGCTHYPALRGVLTAALPGVTIVDSAEAVVDDVVRHVGGLGLDREPEVEYLVTDGADRFMHLGRRLLGRDLTASLIDVS